jgi:hypothetical protein
MTANHQQSTGLCNQLTAWQHYQADISYAIRAEDMLTTGGIQDATQGRVKSRLLEHLKLANHLLTTVNGQKQRQ